MAAVSKWSIGLASNKGDFVTIIPKGSPLPACRTLLVTTALDSQPDLLLAVYMGESRKAAENYPLSNVRLECKEKLAAGAVRVRLTFYAYEHSILRIGVRYKDTEAEQEISIIPASDLSEEDMNKLRAMVARMAKECAPQEIGGADLGVVTLGPVV